MVRQHYCKDCRSRTTWTGSLRHCGGSRSHSDHCDLDGGKARRSSPIVRLQEQFVLVDPARRSGPSTAWLTSSRSHIPKWRHEINCREGRYGASPAYPRSAELHAWEIRAIMTTERRLPSRRCTCMYTCALKTCGRILRPLVTPPSEFKAGI